MATTQAFTHATEDTGIANGSTAGAFSWATGRDEKVMVHNTSGATCYLTFAAKGDTATTASATVHDWVLPDGQVHMIDPSDFDLDNIISVSVWMASGGTDANFTISGK